MAAGSTSARTACSIWRSATAAARGDPNNNAQNSNVLLGKLLRIDVRGDDFPLDTLRDYIVPPGNPFASGANGRPEIWAWASGTRSATASIR